MSDHYQTLGVDRNATPDEIKKAYRKMAGKHHPDKGGDTATFQKVEEAYRILSDPAQKQQYDNPNPFMNSSQPHGFHFNFGGGAFNFDDFFGHVFHQHHQQHRPRHQVYRTTIYVTLEQSYQGGTQSIKIQTPTETHLVNIQVPKGVNNGGQMRYDSVIPNAQLLVEFRVHPHLKFDRKENDLHCSQQVSVFDLIVGTTIKFETISGKEFEVKIQPNTQPNTNLRIPAQGMPIPGTNSYGDQIILIKPYIPDTIDSEIIEAIVRSKSKQP